MTTGATLTQLLAASAMATALQRICSQGVLSEQQEAEMRILVVRSCRAFDIPTIAEAPAGDVQIFERVAP